MNLPEDSMLSDCFDAVVMLTWSDWKTEPRSNRYHYATRFARRLPVYFVQPDLQESAVRFEESGVRGIELLHVEMSYGKRQRELLASALVERRVLRPLLWVYNPNFAEFVRRCHAPLKIYHATEDYFVSGGSGNALIAAKLKQVLPDVDLLVAVSDDVRESYVRSGGYEGESLVLENGCDYSFWKAAPKSQVHGTKIAIYQGAINRRLDWPLVTAVVDSLPHWQFWFCGRAAGDLPQLEELKQKPNFRYFGERSPEQLRDLALQATVGLIPFVQERYIENSMPLKAFEYVACDLPVVSVPINALRKYPGLFQLAANTQEFVGALESAAAVAADTDARAERERYSQGNDYDRRFQKLMEWIDEFMQTQAKRSAAVKANVLILYDINSTHIGTLLEHLCNFGTYSRHEVFYANATGNVDLTYDLDAFDAVVLHYSVRVSLEDHLSSSYAQALRQYPGLKVLFIQDEYDTTETARRWIEGLGVHVVYTCVPQDSIRRVYSKERFPFVDFIPNLTGYAPANPRTSSKPLSERPILIGYRGRRLPYWYGDLGQEKAEIGRRVREICESKGLAVDIEWADDKRIYGDAWYRFLENSRATLGTESGSNVFDEFGRIREGIERAQKANPLIAYDEIRRRFLADEEGRIRMNQISPKIFEAIELRTALILFEGEYSGIVQPDRHFIPLKKDFSNIEDVLARLHDDRFLEELTNRAFQDVILSGRHSYETFIREFDAQLSARVRQGRPARVLGVVGGARLPGTATGWVVALGVRPLSLVTTAPLRANELQYPLPMQIWRALPDLAKAILRPLAVGTLRIAKLAGILRKAY